MLITKITVEEFARTKADDAYQLVLCVHAGEQIVQFRDLVTDSELQGSHDVEAIIAQKIVRQVNLLPEIRSGQAELEIDADAILEFSGAA